MAKSKLQFLKFGTDIWDPSHRFETSWLLPPWVLFGIRALISLYGFTVLLFNIFWNIARHDTPAAQLSFSYFTVLTYWGISFYFAASAIHTFTYARHGGTPFLNRFPRPLQALHYLFYTTITTYPILVTIVFWAVLASDATLTTTFSIWSNTSQHALNSVFALFEISFTRISPPPWIHLPWLILILASYLGLAYLTHYTKDVYVYRFLNSSPKILDSNGDNIGGVGVYCAAYILGIAIGICILFILVKYLITLRKWVTEKKMERLGKFYGGRKMGQGDTELEEIRAWEKQPGEA
ncbi:hypothetical protein B0O99DRAFT_650909 [Bisporella sp. PMI_857]|nr:hypothetical protein B0O99DRAFT_650909 [Bisporella sp. PMI_857]